MVPKPLLDESALDENHVTIIIQRFSDPALVPLPVPLPDT